MVRFTVLASGSKGNSAIVSSCPGGTDSTKSTSCTRILVDAGLSCRELFKRMRQVGEDPETLDAIVITHEHMDHVNGLAVTARKLGIPVYFTEATHRAWMRWLTPRRQMTYAQWIEQCRQQAAARQPEAANPVDECECDDPEPEPALLPSAIAAAGVLAPSQNSAKHDPPKKDPPKPDPTWLPTVEYFQAGR